MRCLRFLGVLLVVSVGCGGQTIESGGDAGGDGATSDSPSKDGPAPIIDGLPPWSPDCPEGAPAMGSPCQAENGLECEYDCNVLVCSAGTWAGAIGSVLCPTGPNPMGCPGALSSIMAGATCSNAGDTCVYPTGICQCNLPSDPSPEETAAWWCGPEGPDGVGSCPKARPRIGSACPVDGNFCQYEQCGSGQVCKKGVWQIEQVACGA
jgi:hypothetical protein